MAIVSAATLPAGDNRRPDIDELVHDYRHRLVSFIQRHYLPDRGDAEDAAMETLEAAWLALDRFNPTSCHVTTWLFAIARRRAVSRRRALRREREVSYEALGEADLQSVGPATDDLRRLHLDRVMDRLSDRERDCVLGVFKRRDSVAELMEDLHLSKPQVRYALRKGMYRLRRGCRGNGPGSKPDSDNNIDRPKRRRKPWTRPSSEGREDDPPATESASLPRR